MEEKINTKVKNKMFLTEKVLATLLITICISSTSFAQSPDQNYVISKVSRVSGLMDDATLTTASSDKSKVQTIIQYVDGIGRPIQTILSKASPLGYDIVTTQGYDSYGREVKHYLPYVPSTGTAGNYRSDALTSAQAAFYNTPPSGIVQIPSSTQIAYGETRFETSPLNRAVEQGAPGLSWKIGGGHTGTFTYSSNTSSDAVKLWVLNTSGSGASYSGSYGDGKLTKTITVNENGNSLIEFKDIDSRVICRKVQSGASTFLVTDYVYDDLGRLRYVIPPLPTASGANSAVVLPSTFDETTTVFLNFFYGYHYDDLDRPTEKKIPGQGWQYLVYDKMDRPIMSQDPNQKTLGYWIVTKYDALGRIVMTGELTSSSTRSSFQAAADASTNNVWEDFTNATTNYGYTHVSYPDISPGTGKKALTISYYDNYDVLSNPSVNPNSAIFSAPSSTIDSLDKFPRSLITASLTNILGTGNYIFSVNHYDKDARVVRTISQHFQGSILAYNKYNTRDNQYSFQGKSTQSIRRHYLPASSSPQVTILTAVSYDHMNRPLLNQQQYTTPTITGLLVTISKSDYNEIGQLKTKHLHNTTAGTPTNSGFLQHIDYRYNSRGWITRINDASNINYTDETFTSQLDIFSENLDYDQITNGLGGTAQYNGNISNIKWQTKLPTSVTLTQEYKGYLFTYDPLNRLTNAAYKAQTVANNSAYDETTSYDELGNILTLTRKNGASSTLNNLAYSYTIAGTRSNKLLSVTDSGIEAMTSNYTYDSNGNLLTDSYKTIAATNPIVYNERNLPSLVTITTGSKTLTYRYDAAGRKLERLTKLGSTVAEDRFYDDGIEYTGNTIESIQTAEGRTLPTSGGYIFEYYITDHLGNIRAMFGDKNNDGMLTADEITQVNDYYPFGRKINYGQSFTSNPDNTYSYNGKELQKDIAEYDYGARFYDPVIARWNTIDPLAEIGRRFSPYIYVENNPIRMIDPDGMTATYSGGNEYYDGEDAVNWALGRQIHGIKEESKGKAIFISFPDKTAEVPRNLNGLREVVKKLTGDSKVPVGHAGVVVIDAKGKTTYYDFGRFDRPDLAAKGQERGVDEGAVRSSLHYGKALQIPDWDFKLTDEENVTKILTKLHNSPLLKEDGRIVGALASNLDADAMNNYARSAEAEGYSPFGGYSSSSTSVCDGTYCAKFARNVGKAGGVSWGWFTFQGIGNISDIESNYNVKRVEIPKVTP
ncbi:DUF6443 domain-containing protein [Mucilaginibacter ginsenosidivorax]|uniref:RHS repeat-associated core domain-containing protein n=1 Tax=Mucilaginibacter ginsenosidivorax TaxID=862126 RepID=A0A5B8W0S7_9SPHI|nr:DUF6443 domain-containing protein [Mucilaginibacter ginsenosidivorax]QEC77273.1 RHS repeat-associated core domain-containing protein [Mucilaginibacter ginsenosidivorax]